MKKVLKYLIAVIVVICGLVCTNVQVRAAAKITVREFKNGQEVEQKYSKKKFLKMNQCTDEKPMLQYYDENEKLQVEVYYNASAKKGCGIRYYENQILGFVISGRYNDYQYKHEKFALTPDGEGNIEKDITSLQVTKLKKTKKYNKAGKLTQYKVTGIFPEEKERVSLVDITFTYSKEGKLVKKVAAYSPFLYGTSNSYMEYNYNSSEQLTYEYGYVTHGSSEIYYVYKNNKTETPRYKVFLDFYSELIDATLYKM